MPKKLPPYRTPRAKVYAAIRRYIWMMSKERQYVLKIEGRQCEECNRKENIGIHHKDGTPLKAIVDLIYDVLLVHPDKLECLCKGCHDKKHERGNG